MALTKRQNWRLASVVAATGLYGGLMVAAPQTQTNNTYHLSVVVLAVIGLTVVGLLLLTWWLGFDAWLQLDRYTDLLPGEEGRRTFGRMATGMWYLTLGLVLSSLLSAVKPFFGPTSDVVAAVTLVNYYIIILFPLLGFMWLRTGSRHLAVSAQAMMSVRSKLLTLGPPIALLATFYTAMAATNSAPDTVTLTSGPTGFLALPVNIVVVVASWILGLLAALNIERATHQGESARLAQPLIKLYNGILTVTGGFIILDALMSLGATRLQALPLEMAIVLLYGFIGVVAVGFGMVARATRELIAAHRKAR